MAVKKLSIDLDKELEENWESPLKRGLLLSC